MASMKTVSAPKADDRDGFTIKVENPTVRLHWAAGSRKHKDKRKKTRSSQKVSLRKDGA